MRSSIGSSAAAAPTPPTASSTPDRSCRASGSCRAAHATRTSPGRSRLPSHLHRPVSTNAGTATATYPWTIVPLPPTSPTRLTDHRQAGRPRLDRRQRPAAHRRASWTRDPSVDLGARGSCHARRRRRDGDSSHVHGPSASNRTRRRPATPTTGWCDRHPRSRTSHLDDGGPHQRPFDRTCRARHRRSIMCAARSRASRRRTCTQRALTMSHRCPARIDTRPATCRIGAWHESTSDERRVGLCLARMRHVQVRSWSGIQVRDAPRAGHPAITRL